MHAETGLEPGILAKIDAASKLGAEYSTIRSDAFAALLSLPFPRSSDELWRQTRPELFPFEMLAQSGSEAFALCDLESGSAVAHPGISISTNFSDASALVKQVLVDHAGGLKRDAIAALQLSVASCAAVIRVKRNTRIERPVLLRSNTEAGTKACAPIVIVLVESGAEFSLVEDLQSADGVFIAPRLEVVLEANSACKFVSIQRMHRESTILARQRFHLARDARLNTFHVMIGGKVSRLDLDCMMFETGASAELNSLYFVDHDSHIDFHPTQDHRAPECQSTLFCKGALRGESRGVYYGLIRVAEGAQKTDAYQKNRNLLLSTAARADSVPNLEIGANDVKCSHGASVGQVSPDELFYLMSRGLTRELAERVLVEGFFEDVISRLPFQQVHDLIQTLVMERLHG